jgi:hypothetical protein
MVYSFNSSEDQQHIPVLRSQLAALRARYDHGAIPLSVYAVVRALEVEIAWTEHREARL